MKPMSFAARVRDAQWKLKHGYSVLSPGRRLGMASATYQKKPSSASAPQPTELPGDDKGVSAASKLPASASPSDAGHLPVGAMRSAPGQEGSANLA